LRAKLQKKGTKSAKRLLKKHRRKEHLPGLRRRCARWMAASATLLDAAFGRAAMRHRPRTERSAFA
jgi:hypothetical protein